MEEERKIANAPPSGPVLKNEFRKEVRDPYAGIPEEELVRRDQVVLMRELIFRVNGYKADYKHISEAIEHAKALRMGILALPKSPSKEGILKSIDGQIENLKKQLETLKAPRQMLITLLALEELFESEPTAEAMASELHEMNGPLINIHPRAELTEEEVVGEPMPVPAEEAKINDSTEAPELSDE